MSNAYELRDTILNYKCKPWNCISWFLELWCLNLIANHSWYFLQCVWMDKAPWIGLGCKNKFWFFWSFLKLAAMARARILVLLCLLGFVYIVYMLLNGLLILNIEYWWWLTNQIFLIFHDWTSCQNWIFLYLLACARIGQHIWIIFGSQIDLRIKSFIFL